MEVDHSDPDVSIIVQGQSALAALHRLRGSLFGGAGSSIGGSERAGLSDGGETNTFPVMCRTREGASDWGAMPLVPSHMCQPSRSAVPFDTALERMFQGQLGRGSECT